MAGPATWGFCSSGFCLCGEMGLLVRQFASAFESAARSSLAKGAPARRAYDMGLLVARWTCRSPTAEGHVGEHWLHMSYINLSLMHMTMVLMQPSSDPMHSDFAAASGKIALELQCVGGRALRFLNLWHAAQSLGEDNLHHEWQCDFFVLVTDDTQVPDFVPGEYLTVAPLTAVHSLIFWQGPPQPRPRHRRRGGRGKGSGRGKGKGAGRGRGRHIGSGRGRDRLGGVAGEDATEHEHGDHGVEEGDDLHALQAPLVAWDPSNIGADDMDTVAADLGLAQQECPDDGDLFGDDLDEDDGGQDEASGRGDLGSDLDLGHDTPPPPTSGVAASSSSSAPPPAPPPPPPQGRGGRGWASRARSAPYEVGFVGTWGKIRINTHPNAQSLDSECSRCGARKNKRYKANAKDPSGPQGRPMGAHILWLKLCPGTDQQSHKDLWNDGDLPFSAREEERTFGEGLGTLSACFDRERSRCPGEGPEPLRLA